MERLWHVEPHERIEATVAAAGQVRHLPPPISAWTNAPEPLSCALQAALQGQMPKDLWNLNIIADISGTNAARQGIYATLLAHSITKDADALVAYLSAKVCERRRNKGQEAAINKAVGAFLANLLQAKESEKANGFVYRSMQAQAFTGEAVSYRTFSFVVESFVALGWLEHFKGEKRWTANGFDSAARPFASGGHASRFRMTPALRALCEGVTSDHFIEPLPEHPIILRASSTGHGNAKARGKTLDFVPTERTQLLEQQMRELNLFLSGFELRPYRFTGLVRIFNEGDTPSFDWNKGGRLYARGELQYQFQSKEDRKQITIDGESSKELDIRASYLATYHGLMRQPFDPSADPYAVEGFDRTAVKLWTMATFGKAGHLARWPKELSDDYKSEFGKAPPKVKDIRDAMVAKFPVLEQWGRSGHTWATLQYHELSAVFAAMFMLMKVHKVPAYPVHDSLIVRVRDAEVARMFLIESYKRSLGVDVEVK